MRNINWCTDEFTQKVFYNFIEKSGKLLKDNFPFVTSVLQGFSSFHFNESEVYEVKIIDLDVIGFKYKTIKPAGLFPQRNCVKIVKMKSTKFLSKIFEENGVKMSTILAEEFKGIVATLKDDLALPKFLIVHGEDIKKYYYNGNYYNDKGSLGSSCMRYADCENYFDVYTENENCSMLILVNNEFEVFGRALLWNVFENLDDSKDKMIKLMDRIYVNDNLYCTVFKNWANANGYEYKKTQTYGNDDWNNSCLNGKIMMTNFISKEVIEYFPYIDSLRFLYRKHESEVGYNYLLSTEKNYSLEDSEYELLGECERTDGYFEGDGNDENEDYYHYCDNCETGLWDDHTHIAVESNDGTRQVLVLCDSCLENYHEINGTYYNIEDLYFCNECDEYFLEEEKKNIVELDNKLIDHDMCICKKCLNCEDYIKADINSQKIFTFNDNFYLCDNSDMDKINEYIKNDFTEYSFENEDFYFRINKMEDNDEI